MEQNKDQGGAAVRGEAVAESSTMRFRKKPVEIEAIQWTGKLSCLDAFNIPELHQSLGSNNVGIPTLEGTMIAHVGDWIIKGVKGEFYPCKPDIFELTYVSARAADAPSEPSEKLYFVRMTKTDGWREASEAAYWTFSEVNRRILFQSRAADALDNQPTEPDGLPPLPEPIEVGGEGWDFDDFKSEKTFSCEHMRAYARAAIASSQPTEAKMLCAMEFEAVELGYVGLAEAMAALRRMKAAPDADREALIACLGDDAATLSHLNPDDEMAQTMREAIAMLESDEVVIATLGMASSQPTDGGVRK